MTLNQRINSNTLQFNLSLIHPLYCDSSSFGILDINIFPFCIFYIQILCHFSICCHLFFFLKIGCGQLLNYIFRKKTLLIAGGFLISLYLEISEAYNSKISNNTYCTSYNCSIQYCASLHNVLIRFCSSHLCIMTS